MRLAWATEVFSYRGASFDSETLQTEKKVASCYEILQFYTLQLSKKA